MRFTLQCAPDIRGLRAAGIPARPLVATLRRHVASALATVSRPHAANAIAIRRAGIAMTAVTMTIVVGGATEACCETMREGSCCGPQHSPGLTSRMGVWIAHIRKCAGALAHVKNSVALGTQ